MLQKTLSIPLIQLNRKILLIQSDPNLLSDQWFPLLLLTQSHQKILSLRLFR
jgi:hypothetical protein